MILVDISDQGPAILDPTHAPVADALIELERYHRRTDAGLAPAPVRSEIFTDPTVRDGLREAFHGKCAYCESPDLPSAPLEVAHFRPTGGAIGADGTERREHYWWLTYSWTNLLLACSDCVRAKGNRFPVDGPRAGPGEPATAERYLLLDPRRREGDDGDDSPSGHLVFLADGSVASVTARGTATIDVLALNRSTLVSARRVVATEVADAIGAARGTGRFDAVLADLSDPSQPYLALRQQLVGTALRDQNLTDAPVDERLRRRTKAAYDSSQLTRQSVGLGDNVGDIDDAGRSSYFAAARWIERVVIKNFRPIDRIDLDLSRSTSTAGPWQVLLGDNGGGKSSILQAIALTLIGPAERAAISLRPAEVLRHGARSGRVEVYLSGLPKPLVLRFDRDSIEFDGESVPQVLLLAYGSMRLLQREAAGATPDAPATVKVTNLFDPLAPITDPTTWLLSLDDAQFADVALSLGALLTLDERARIERTPTRVFIRQGRRRDSLSELSDGYQSMLVLTCDVMATVLALWGSPAQAEGIVLIDELGAHLHPRWRMRVVRAMRTVLPRVQFVVTTHDPLCLRGLEDGEVAVVRRNDDGKVVVLSDLPPVKGLRVEQLLTSEHFGLGSTEDPDVDALFAEYYRLRGRTRPTKAERARIDALETELGDLRQLGTTERERLLLRSADEFIARRRAEGDEPGPKAPAPSATTDAVMRELAEIWSMALPSGTERA
jgi:5-methylcytosine-specific restriction endonuclease McrA